MTAGQRRGLADGAVRRYHRHLVGHGIGSGPAWFRSPLRLPADYCILA